MQKTDDSPRFPPEIEKAIFEAASKNERQSAVAVVRVARRVQRWTEPILYETISLWGRPEKTVNNFMRTVLARPPQFFATNVKKLCLVNNYLRHEDEKRVLEICTGVERLACYLYNFTPADNPALTSDRCWELAGVFRIPSNLPVENPDFMHPVYSTVTHMQLIAHGAFWAAWSGYGMLPNLAHLAVNDWNVGPLIAQSLKTILETCPRLRVLILLTSGDHITRRSVDPDEIIPADDSRLVLLYHPGLQDWEAWGDGRSGLWERGELKVEEQTATLSRRSSD